MVYNVAVPLCHVLLCLPHRVLGASVGSETITEVRKCRLEYRRQNLHHRLLDYPVPYTRHSKKSDTSVVLRYLDPFYRLGLVLPCAYLFANPRQVVPHEPVDFFDTHTVNAGTALVSFHVLHGYYKVIGREHPLAKLCIWLQRVSFSHWSPFYDTIMLPRFHELNGTCRDFSSCR